MKSWSYDFMSVSLPGKAVSAKGCQVLFRRTSRNHFANKASSRGAECEPKLSVTERHDNVLQSPRTIDHRLRVRQEGSITHTVLQTAGAKLGQDSLRLFEDDVGAFEVRLGTPAS